MLLRTSIIHYSVDPALISLLWGRASNVARYYVGFLSGYFCQKSLKCRMWNEEFFVIFCPCSSSFLSFGILKTFLFVYFFTLEKKSKLNNYVCLRSRTKYNYNFRAKIISRPFSIAAVFVFIIFSRPQSRETFSPPPFAPFISSPSFISLFMRA